MINILIRGLIYGIFSIIPGLSGGALAFQYGDYNKCIQIISNRDLQIENLKYLIILGIGFIAGSSLCSRIILVLYESFKIFFKVLIIVLNLYLLIKLSLSKNKKLLVKIILSTIIIYFIFINININMNLNMLTMYLVCAVIFSFSKVVPGFSSTSILVNIGFYDELLLFFSNPFKELYLNFYLWILFINVAAISSYVFIKLIVKYNGLFSDLVIILLIINTIDLII
jgi:uncharacterized membrane protein